ncbi:MAG: tyrosine-type recombinase/integrase [Calditrichaeota bacterium]|nr:tyrosine-type recombinase/integrase [Calditrichota bacterium]
MMAKLIYGCVLRLQECLCLLVKDLDFEQNQLIVRSGKGDKDRRTILPQSIKDSLITHLKSIRLLYDNDRLQLIPRVALPEP